MSGPATGRLPLFRTLVLVTAFAARQISWSRKTVFVILLLLVPTGLAVIVRDQAPPGTIDDFRRQVLPNITLVLVNLLCLFHAAGLVRDGMEDKTLQFLLTRPLGKARIVLGLYLGMLLYVLPLALLAAAGGFLACRAGLSEGLFVDDKAPLPAFIRLELVVALAVAFYGALYNLFGLVFRLPTIIGMVFLLAIDGALGSFPGPPRYLSPTAYLERLLTGPATVMEEQWFNTRASVRDFAYQATDATTAFVVLLVAWALVVGITYYLARGKDYVVYEKKPQ